MQIIAEKYPRKRAFIVILLASVFLIVIGAGLLVASGMVVNFPDALDIIAFALIIIGAACTGMMVFSLVRFLRLPQTLITYENGVLAFPKGSCRADEVTSVDYKHANPSYKNVSYDFGFGMITVEAGGRKLKAYYVANPVEVYEKLRKIVGEAKLMK